jgi:peptide subunit release factor 1 (eRF1)
VARLPDGERTEQVEDEQGPHLHRSSPGGWSQPRGAGQGGRAGRGRGPPDADDLMARFAQERGRGPGGLATEGAEATLAALAKSQVEVLLIADDPDDERRAWFGALPQQLGLDRATVEAMGESLPVEGRLADVAVRAALATSADVHVLDPDGAGLRDGFGALLRFAIRR